MDTLLQQEKKEKGSNKVLFAAIGAAILIVAVLVGFYATRPPHEEKKKQYLEGAYLQGSPEFEVLTKKIVIINDADNTLQSPTGLGTITMFTRSKIRNISDKTITALEIQVGVLDQFDKVIREKKQIIIPTFQETLPPNQDISITVPIEGFSKDDDRARVQWKVTAIKVQ
ncbi:hypothetical protein BH10ACI1_BH10ACI1_26310 [soil metagenome]